MRLLFRSAHKFDRDVSKWDVGRVTDVGFMFLEARAFNQDLSEWCVAKISSEPASFGTGSVLSLSNYPIWGTCYDDFYEDQNGCVVCDSLNIGDQFVLNGDTMVVVDRPMLDSMIIGGYDVTEACVSHVTDMSWLIYQDSSFNQAIGTWDVSNVTNMDHMFGQSFFVKIRQARLLLKSLFSFLLHPCIFCFLLLVCRL